jgi:tripartite-type tricarboxylate transporter receptor subunit TctC
MRRGRLAILACLLIGVAPAGAQTWPSKPVRVIVASSAGGIPDLAARHLSERFARVFKAPFVVENIMGGGGLLGATQTARAAPDGYTLWLASSTHLSSNPYMYKSLPYDPGKDYDVVAALFNTGFVFAVNADLPVKNIEDLVTVAKGRKLFYASTSPRGAAGIAGEYFNHVAGIKMVQVPYKTTALAATDTASGTTQLIIISYGVVQPFVESGRIRVIAVSSSNRHARLPDIKTVGETYPGYATDNYIALVGPRGMPRDVITKLNREVLAFLKDPPPANSDPLTTVGKGSPEEATEYIRKDRDERWATMVKVLGIKPQ